MEVSSIWEHVDLMQIILSSMAAVVAWLMIATLKKIDANQEAIFNRLLAVERGLAELHGAHNAIHPSR